MDSNNIATQLPSCVDIEDEDTTLGPLTPVSRHHSMGFRRRSSFSEVGSFTTPQEAAGVGFRSVGAGMIQTVQVSGKPTVGEEEGEGEGEEGMLAGNGGMGNGEEEKGGVEMYVNGALYTLHTDAILRPTTTTLPISITPTAPFTGYAIRANSIFKPLGGSPAAIDVTTLYRVTPTPTATTSLSTTAPDSEVKAYHRIKPVQQLLSRGTSGQEENMYIYDSQQQGFVRTSTTARFPAEEALALRGELVGEAGVGNCEELFASAERALRRAEREEAVRRKKRKNKKEKEKRFPSIATQVAQFQPSNSSPLAGPARQGSEQSACTNGGQGQSSWLNIDLPLPLQRPGAPHSSIFTESASYTHALPPVPTIPAAAAHHHPPRTPSVTSSITSSINQWTSRFSPRHILGGGTAGSSRCRTPQHADLYAPAVTLQQLVNECVLVLCVYGHRRSRDPRIARLALPNGVDDDFDDAELLLQMRARYNSLRGFWRRALSLRGLRRIAVVEYHRAERHVSSTFQGPTHSPTRLLECYLHPYKCTGERHWVEWAHRLSLDEDRYALEFVEAWRADKVVLAGVVPLSLSVIAGVVWSLYGPDQRHLAAFVLAILVVVFGWSVVALMAVVSYLV
ncbi:uncharacterized protein H6S33_004251 [Morchella sextelata]|uniref:uncharacterized protein n=1 Tax=Morchella sextelata TaxID=1174677 RepID=UPI001D056D63|nr:uncharacterized protein H6S33_004251 [Morchella sextelata]KAH0605794.1 hypothetical protein H6S33_004251 [Morchella sextelata]